eukprot:scaffold90511_cov39-Cyclotella_meneghiniana.AAC.1
MHEDGRDAGCEIKVGGKYLSAIVQTTATDTQHPSAISPSNYHHDIRVTPPNLVNYMANMTKSLLLYRVVIFKLTIVALNT